MLEVTGFDIAYDSCLKQKTKSVNQQCRWVTRVFVPGWGRLPDGSSSHGEECSNTLTEAPPLAVATPSIIARSNVTHSSSAYVLHAFPVRLWVQADGGGVLLSCCSTGPPASKKHSDAAYRGSAGAVYRSTAG
jgi:hypothetical protein